MRDRLTAHYVYYDGQHGYEALGHDAFSQRPFIEITKKLALYEDTGYTPKEVAELRDKLLGNTADDWMGMYNVAAERAIKAEAENEWLKRALSDVEDWCVEFHVTGPHDPEKALKIVMTIYDIVHEQLGDRTEECRVSEEGER